jgi:hypothetical protein
MEYNNNQAFYSQTSWGKLKMKPHEQKNSIKQEQKEEKTKGDKKPNQKGRKNNKMLSKKMKNGQGEKLDKRQ